METKKYTHEEVEQMRADFFRGMQELREENLKSSQELNKKFAKTDKKIKEVTIQLGGIGNSNGDFAEDFFFNAFDATMEINDIKYDYIVKNQNKKIKDLKGEYDIVLVNSNKILIIEVKYKLKIEQVKQFYNNKISKYKKLFSEFKNYTIHAAMAGMSFDKHAKNEVIKNGMLLFTQAGDNLKRLSPKNMKLTEF